MNTWWNKALCLSFSIHLFLVSFFFFLLSGGDEEKDFDIQKNTGTILIARRLDAARRSNYNMTVRVTDGHHNATTQVRLWQKHDVYLQKVNVENPQ